MLKITVFLWSDQTWKGTVSLSSFTEKVEKDIWNWYPRKLFMGEKFVSNTDCTICIEIAKAIMFKKCQYAKNGAQCQELRAHHEPVTKNSGPMPTPWHMRQSPSEGIPALVCIPHPEERLGSLRCPIAYHLSWKLHLIFPFSKHRCSNQSLEKTKS